MKYSSTRRSELLMLLLALSGLIALGASSATANTILPNIQSDVDRLGLDDLQEYITGRRGGGSLMARDEPINSKIMCETSNASPSDEDIRLNIMKLRKLGDKKCGIDNGIGSK